MKHESKRITISKKTFERMEKYMKEYGFTTYWDFVNVSVHTFCNYLDNKNNRSNNDF